MRNLFVTFLALLYLVQASGFTRYTHVCRGAEVKLQSLFNTGHDKPGKPCPLCSGKEESTKKKKKNCCEHQVSIFKPEEAVQKQLASTLPVVYCGDSVPHQNIGAVFDIVSAHDHVPGTHFPWFGIPFRGNPIYLLHRVFRI